MQFQLQNLLFLPRGPIGFAGAPLPPLTGFNFIPNAVGAAIAAWNVPPAGATATELWTSPDNVTFSLDSTNPAPASGANTTAPAVGSFKWAKARWVSASSQGAFCASQEVSGRACDWAARVITNGGANTTLTTRTAINTLDLALVAASLDSSCLWILPVPPDGLSAALTPLYKVIGNDPAVGSNLVAGDLTASGLAGNASNKSFDTGVNQTAINGQSAGSCSYFCYRNTTNNNTEADMDMNDASNTFGLLSNTTPALTFDSPFSAGSGRVTVAQSLWKGYYLGSRTSVTFAAIYLANSTTAHNQAGTNNTNIGNIPASNTNFWGLAQNNVGVINFASGKTYGGFGFLKGLTQAQSLAFYNAWQAYRTAVGGAV